MAKQKTESKILMSSLTENHNEMATAEAFSKQSLIFDDIYSSNTIVTYKRERVRSHVLRYLKPGGNILELNSGTGEDAIFFAQQGYKVHATDIATGMQQQLRNKAEKAGLSGSISTELRSYTQLSQLQNKGPFDLVFSNFAGLNCTDQLGAVLLSLPSLVNKGGIVTLVLLPKFCLWEFLLLFKGKFKTAFRRLFSSRGVTAHIEGTYFTCWYYNPSFVINTLQNSFKVIDTEGLCTIVPPSYIEHFAEQHPSSYAFLKKAENRLKRSCPFRVMGDYYIISLQKI